jgi:hypothetical protein
LIKVAILVAHPDDCVIFAWPFVEAHPEFDYTVIYLTYTIQSDRGLELSKYWERRNIPTRFLGFLDDWEYVKNGQLGFDPAIAESAILESLTGFDLVVTHNNDGDYGHPHHKFVSACADKIGIPKVYFASTFNYNQQYAVKNSVNIDELPLHQEVIEQFHTRDTGLYVITESAQQLLK